MDRITTAVLGAPSALRTRSPSESDGARPSLVETMRRLHGDGRCVTAGAPIPLDVMGGLGECAGGLLVRFPLQAGAHVAVALRSDGQVAAVDASHGPSDEDSILEAPVSLLRDATARARVVGDGAGTAGPAARVIVGVVAELLRSGSFARLERGVTVVFRTPSAEGASRLIALASATLVGVLKAVGAEVDQALGAKQVCAALDGWSDETAGRADVLCAMNGEAGTLRNTQGDAADRVGSIKLPEGFSIVGVDCGCVADDAALKNRRVLTCTRIGMLLIDRIIRHEGAQQLQWDGQLARISIADYVDRFRDRLPTKIKGAEFLKCAGDEAERVGEVEPSFVYKVRSRTEHHIYEHARTRQFVESLSRAFRTGDRLSLIEAGELMCASHWSYGQRCGLGSVEADLMVNLMRQHGAAGDLLGARITGAGCGGMLAVLMRSSDRADDALRTAMDEFASRTGQEARRVDGSAPGALVAGAQVM